MEIAQNARILFDENNVILQFFEQRERTKKDGTKEPYEYQDNYYYGSVKQALKSYLNKSLKYAENIQEILRRIDEVEQKIDALQIINR